MIRLLVLGLLSLNLVRAEFVPLFNGRDLSGWVDVNCHPETWKVVNGEIVSTGRPTGFLRTEKMYENFILEFEWLHEPRADGKEGNSGLFVWADGIPAPGQGNFARAIEVQILCGLEWKDQDTGALTATSHGDVFAIWGMKAVPDRAHPRGWMRSIPDEQRAKGFGEWNHYRVTAKDGTVTLAVNGHEVSSLSQASIRKGYLALESEGNPVRFRNLRIQELASTNPTPAETAFDATGWVRLYNRRDLAGWRQDAGHAGHWVAADWKLAYDGKSEAQDKNLWTEKSYRDFELICDWRFTTKTPRKSSIPVVLADGTHAKNPDGTEQKQEIDDYGDSGIYLRGSSKSQVNLWCWPIGSGEVYGYRTDLKQPPAVRAGVTPRKNADRQPGEWNRMHITLRGDRLTVVSNGETVLEDAQLPGMAPEGPLALQHHGDPIEFANLYLRELSAR